MKVPRKLPKPSSLSRLKRIEELLERQFDARRGLPAKLADLQETVDALQRQLALRDLELPPAQRLTAQRFRGLSQNGEDGMVLALLREAGIEHATFAEIGAGINGGNSGFLAQELGWRGLMVDGDKKRVATLGSRFHTERVIPRHAWVTRENINALLTEGRLEGEIDFLSIDIDGNDIWIWEAIQQVSARIVVIEFNQIYGIDDALATPYDPEFNRRQYKSLYFGASLPAVVNMGRRLGYRLVAVEPRGVNAFLLRDDVAPRIPEVDAITAMPHRHARAGSVQRFAAGRNLELVEVS